LSFKEKAKSYIDFLKITAKNFQVVGALFPSSRFTVRSIVQHIESDTPLIVEFGAGLGTVTKEILKKVSPSTKLVVVERNPDFWPFLEKINDTRLQIFKGGVLEFKEKLKALSPSGIPIIVSGIPLSLMTPEIEDQVLRTTKELIGQRGKFIIYQHHPNIYKKIANVFPKYEKYFEPLNFPPYIILVARNQ
jgi:phospholipid N-methyltransferase